MTEYLRPSSLAEAFRIRAEHPGYQLLAGGTDLMVGVRERPAPSGVIDLFGVPGLCKITDNESWIHVGAGVTYAQLLESTLVKQKLSILHQSAREIGAVQIQERGTLGGNVGTSSPVGDTLPVLLALDAVVELASMRGIRRVLYSDFCTGYREIDLEEDELIVAIDFPNPEGLHQYWRKVGTRRAQAISKVMVAATAGLNEQGQLHSVRLAMGAVADRPVRLRQSEDLLRGQVPSRSLAIQLREQVGKEILPITDLRSTAEYRLSAAANLAARFVLNLASGSE